MSIQNVNNFNTFIFLNVYSDYSRGIAISHATNLKEAINYLVEEDKKLKRQHRFQELPANVHTSTLSLHNNSNNYLEQIYRLLFGSNFINSVEIPYYQWSQLNKEELYEKIVKFPHSSFSPQFDVEITNTIYQLLQDWKNNCIKKHKLYNSNEPYQCFSTFGTAYNCIDFATLLYNSEILIIPCNLPFALINGGHHTTNIL